MRVFTSLSLPQCLVVNLTIFFFSSFTRLDAAGGFGLRRMSCMPWARSSALVVPVASLPSAWLAPATLDMVGEDLGLQLSAPAHPEPQCIIRSATIRAQCILKTLCEGCRSMRYALSLFASAAPRKRTSLTRAQDQTTENIVRLHKQLQRGTRKVTVLFVISKMTLIRARPPASS